MTSEKKCRKCEAPSSKVELKPWGGSFLCVPCKKVYDKDCRERSKLKRGIVTADRSPVLTDKGQVCKECGKDKQLSDFYKNPNISSGYDRSCKECRIAHNKRVRDEKALLQGPKVKEKIVLDPMAFPYPCFKCGEFVLKDNSRPWGTNSIVCKECSRAYGRDNQARHRIRKGVSEYQPSVSDSDTQVCDTCDEEKPWDGFYKNLFYATGYERKCIQCRKDRRKRIWKDNIGGHRDMDLARLASRTPEELKQVRDRNFRVRLRDRYKMTPDQYQSYLDAQGGVCFLCQKPETQVNPRTGMVQKLSVDHDHSCCPGNLTCGECVRGLLCHECNIGLGKLESRGVDFHRVMEYLKLV